MSSKICITCKEVKDLTLFNNRVYKNKSDGKNNICKSCQAISGKKHYISNRDKIIKRTKDRKDLLSLEIRLFILSCLSGGCVDCGEKDILTLDFDHLRDKVYGISAMTIKLLSIDLIRNEISKCEIRCANCHRRKTFKQINCWRYKYI